MHEPAYNPSVVPDITRSAPLTARHQQAPRPRRDPYDGLRPWSAITHGAGAVLALVGTAFLLVRAAGLEDWIKFSAFLVYGLSMIGLYTASTLYHCVNTTVRGRLALRKYDHCSIYLLIAGSYTPLCLTAFGTAGGPVLLALVWSVGVVGMILTITKLSTPAGSPARSTCSWLAGHLRHRPIRSSPVLRLLLWLMMGAAMYTVGGVLYAVKWPGRNTPALAVMRYFMSLSC